MSILGNRVLRKEDVGFLTEGACYTDDLNEPALEGALWVTYVRSTMAHAKIVVDASDAVNMPGVAGVFALRTRARSARCSFSRAAQS